MATPVVGTSTANLGHGLRHAFIWLERVLSGWKGCFNGAKKGAKDLPNLQCNGVTWGGLRRCVCVYGASICS